MEYWTIFDATISTLKERRQLLLSRRLDQAQYENDLNSGTIANQVAFATHEAGLWTTRGVAGMSKDQVRRDGGHLWPKENSAAVRSVLWYLVRLGVLVPLRMADPDNQFFEITPYGITFIENTTETPHDPMGFIASLRRNAPYIADKTITYVEEAINCYLSHYDRPAAVMVGLASENELLTVFDLYGDHLDTTAKVSYQAAIGKKFTLKQKFDYFYERLTIERNELPIEIRETDTWLKGIYEVIRLYRNDSGHPNGNTPTHDEVYANLVLFRTYAQRLSQLKVYLGALASKLS